VEEAWFWLGRPVIWGEERISSGRALLRLRRLEPGLYLLAGEAGVGKSALLDFFARGLGFYHLKHRACPAPWRVEGAPDAAWEGVWRWRTRWVVLAEGVDPELWRAWAREFPVVVAVASDELEVAEPPELRGKLHLPAFRREEARSFLYRLAGRLRRRYRGLPPRRRPSWVGAYWGLGLEELRAWADEAARVLDAEPFSGLAVPLLLRLWAEAFPPGWPAPRGLGELAGAVVAALAEHAGVELDEEAALALARLRPRPWVRERDLRREGIWEGVLELVRIGIARRYCPDCFGFAHPLFFGYFLARAETPRVEDGTYPWLFFYRRLCREELERGEGRLALALDPDTPYEVLEELAKDPLLRWAVAANPGAPRELLAWIEEQAREADPFTREGLRRLAGRR